MPHPTPAADPGAPGAHAGCVALEGDWTVIRAAELRPLLAQSVAAGAQRLDLSRITEIDSAGLQLLLSARRSAATHGIELAFDAPSSAVRALAAVYRLDAGLRAVGAGA
jgi:anti-sigma B factor antagonist